MPERLQDSEITRDEHGRAAYRLREVSAMLGIPVSTLRTMVRRGEINPITAFGTWLIAAEDLQALVKKRLRNHREPSPSQPPNQCKAD
jgi:hypothetical protein